MIRRLTILLLIVGCVCYGTTINVPADSTTIQAGINGAEEGDTVLVAAGTYYENIIWVATNGIKLIGSGEDDCFIDGDSLANVIWFLEDLGGIIDSTTLITGFTIQNGLAHYAGGGMLLHNSSPTLTDVTFIGNSVKFPIAWGGGMWLDASNPTLTDVTFIGNTAIEGGGMWLHNSSPTLTGVTFSGNTAYVGGGMWLHNSSPTLTGVTFSGNTAYEDGGGMYLLSSNPTLTNSILWDNSPVENYLNSSIINTSYSDIQGGFEGDGNIDAAPLFVDPENGDFTLQAGSPCIDVGTADTDGDGYEDIIDYCGFAPDMGAYEYCLGCMDETACNYNANATDSGDCIHTDGICDTCVDGVIVDNDGDDDGVCDDTDICDGYNDTLDSDGDGTPDGCDLSIYEGIIPDHYSIASIYPNPFNPVTKITYGLPENKDVRISVYNMTGTQVTSLVNTFQIAGYHTISWNASSYPSGVYLIRMESGEFTQTQKVVLVK